MKFRRIFTALAVIVLAVGLDEGCQASAASASPAGCLAGYACQYRNLNYTGDLYQWTAGFIQQQPGRCWNLTASANNSATALYNNTGANIIWWNGPNCTDIGYGLTPGHGVALLPGAYNDQASSIGLF